MNLLAPIEKFGSLGFLFVVDACFATARIVIAQRRICRQWQIGFYLVRYNVFAVVPVGMVLGCIAKVPGVPPMVGRRCFVFFGFLRLALVECVHTFVRLHV